MVSQTISYLGSLRCKAVHGPSKVEFISDAPKDNHGRGESFSPTDLLVTALAACSVTSMGIRAQGDALSLDGTAVYAEKHMGSDSPRRVSKIVIRIDMAPAIPRSYRSILEQTARTCPVAKSIHPDIVVELSFRYPDE
jgi:putative redox protein